MTKNINKRYRQLEHIYQPATPKTGIVNLEKVFEKAIKTTSPIEEKSSDIEEKVGKTEKVEKVNKEEKVEKIEKIEKEIKVEKEEKKSTSNKNNAEETKKKNEQG